MWNVLFTGLILTYRSESGNCAHLCRYCSIGKMKAISSDFRGYSELIVRLNDWVKKNRSEFSIGTALIDRNYEPHLDDEKAELISRLGKEKLSTVTTGGLRLRNKIEINDLLDYWKSRDVTCVHSSFGGLRATHDYYNRRNGDFDQLIEFQRMASEKGMDVGQSVFLTNQTIDQLSDLEKMLDSIKVPRYRNIYPFGYLGLARTLEGHRINETQRDALIKERQSTLLRPGSWYSEREWINKLNGQLPWIGRTPMVFDIDDGDINRFKKMGCADIIGYFEGRANSIFLSLPDVCDLIRNQGNIDNDKVYSSANDVIALWLDRYFGYHSSSSDLICWGNFVEL